MTKSYENDILTGVVMLETMWVIKHKDMVDLITPFVVVAVAKTTNVNDFVNVVDVANYVDYNFGYKDFPTSIVEKVLKRNNNRCFKKQKGSFRLLRSLEEEVIRFESRRIDCTKKIEVISKSLSTYLTEHCKYSFSEQAALVALQDFFSRRGIYVGTAKLAKIDISRQVYEADYYIARYIFEMENEQKVEYNYLMDLMKGYYLQTAIYLQPNNTELRVAGYKNTVFYYDTPFLLSLLGYQSEEEKRAAEILHNLLTKQGAKFGYFTQTKSEIESILLAYQHSLISGKYSKRTLEGLDKRKYTFSDVDRLKKGFVNSLKQLKID